MDHVRVDLGGIGGGLPVSVDRKVVVYRYVPGHSQLVLRSTGFSIADYIEITFHGVAAMKLHDLYTPLTIDMRTRHRVRR